jgi:hypothetical protein
MFLPSIQEILTPDCQAMAMRALTWQMERRSMSEEQRLIYEFFVALPLTASRDFVSDSARIVCRPSCFASATEWLA